MLDIQELQPEDFETTKTKALIHDWLTRNNLRFVGIQNLNPTLFNYITTKYNASELTKRKNGEIFYNYMNSQDIPICPGCNAAHIKFLSYNKGYALFCGTKCAARESSDSRMKTMISRYGDDPFKNENIVNKRRNTNLERYGHINPVCSNEIAKKKKQTMIDKYGVDHYSKTAAFKEKFTSTMNQRYGVEYAMQSSELRDRYTESLMTSHGVCHPSQSPILYQNRNKVMKERYGVEHAMQSEELSNKHKRTLTEKYGVEYPLQCKEIQQRMKDTMVDRYGKEYSAQVDFIFEKLKQTNLERYGVEYPIQNEDIKEAIKQTNLERYGVEYPIQNEDIKEAIKQTNLERYGVGHASQSPEFQKRKRQRMEESGKWIPLELLSDFEKYYRLVWKTTNKQPLTTLQNFNKRGLAGLAGAFHVDHKLSIKYGFEHGIPPYIIGNIHNLEMLPWKDNVYKSSKCSILAEDLFLLIFS